MVDRYFGTLNSVKKIPGPARGPRPARRRSQERLSGTRASLLETLQAQAEPVGVDALATLSGLHPNTVREHLEGLRDAGLVSRSPAPAEGRGRPAWRYEATGASQDDPRPEYAGLAVALARVIVRTSAEPVQDARRAGVEWGQELARESGLTPAAVRRESAARRAVNEVFDDMGFAPEPDADHVEVRLTRCPLLQAAREHPDVVCSVHQGIAEGLMTAAGGTAAGVELVPFAEPGACRLRLGRSA